MRSPKGIFRRTALGATVLLDPVAHSLSVRSAHRSSRLISCQERTRATRPSWLLRVSSTSNVNSAALSPKVLADNLIKTRPPNQTNDLVEDMLDRIAPDRVLPFAKRQPLAIHICRDGAKIRALEPGDKIHRAVGPVLERGSFGP